jgi:hypothetical protein
MQFYIGLAVGVMIGGLVTVVLLCLASVNRGEREWEE